MIRIIDEGNIVRAEVSDEHNRIDEWVLKFEDEEAVILKWDDGICEWVPELYPHPDDARAEFLATIGFF